MEEDRPSWNFFEDILPPEVTLTVFSFLELEDVVYASLVCKTWSTYFDTKDIWKRIYENTFGMVDEKKVDVTQNLRWKRLFVQASNLNQKWKKHFANAQRTFRCIYQYEAQTVVANRYHVLISICPAIVDLRVATKMVQVKHNPVTLQCFHLSGVNELNSKIKAFCDTKPPKEDEYKVPSICYSGPPILSANGRGEYLLRDISSLKCFVWKAENQVLNQGKTNSLQILTPHEGVYGNCVWGFNSKFVVYNNRDLKTFDVCIIDLSKRCSHCCIGTLKNGTYVTESIPYPCQPRTTLCAIIERFPGPFDWIYVSQCAPDLVIMAYYNRMFIWRYGLFKESEEVKLPDVKTFTNCGEHLVEGKGHWFTYTTTTQTQSVPKTTFIDLNNVKDKVDMPMLAKYLFVPKKPQVLCTNKKTIVAFDLERKVWVSKIVIDKDVRAVTFSKSAAILFVATESHIYAYQWETSRLISLFEHDNPHVNSIHFALDQVLVITSNLYGRSAYWKIMTKLEF